MLRNNNKHLFFDDNDFLSEWYKINFVIDGINFNSLKQYIIYKKAKLFKNDDIANKIIQITKIKSQKRLEKLIKNIDNNIWNEHKINIIYEGNFEKFNQNPLLKKLLLDTGDRLLINSTYDVELGIGLNKNDDKIFNELEWRGKNLLGKLLIKLRESFFLFD